MALTIATMPVLTALGRWRQMAAVSANSGGRPVRLGSGQASGPNQAAFGELLRPLIHGALQFCNRIAKLQALSRVRSVSPWGCLVWHGRPGECGPWAVSLKVAEGGRCGLDHGQDASLVFLSQPVEPFQPRCRMRDQDRMRRSRAASAPTSIASRTVRGVRTAGPDRHQPGRCPVRPPSA